MKTRKLFSVVALCVMAIALNAANVAKITVTSTGGGSDDLYIVEDTPFTPAYESGSDIEKMMNSGQAYSINLYAVSAGKNLSMICTNDLTNTPLTFQSNTTETSYTMTFSNVSGTVKLYDAVTGTETVLANSGTYNFTCAANTTIADRFFINYVPAAPEICHRYGKLQVTGSKDMTVKVLNMDGSATSIADTNITTNSQVEISLAGLAAGQYKVEWNSQTLIIDVK